jgi:hypothetical protein
MAKRSDYIKIARDKYYTPIDAVKPLIPFLPLNDFLFCEPCGGDGRLINHIEQLSKGTCSAAYDIEPDVPDIEELDSTLLEEQHLHGADLIITNSPWTRTKASGYLLHELIRVFSDLRPTYLLFDADWIHTIQSSELVKERLCKIISIGRVKWIEDSAGSGKDNACWYLFDAKKAGPTQFYGR